MLSLSLYISSTVTPSGSVSTANLPFALIRSSAPIFLAMLFALASLVELRIIEFSLYSPFFDSISVIASLYASFRSFSTPMRMNIAMTVQIIAIRAESITARILFPVRFIYYLQNRLNFNKYIIASGNQKNNTFFFVIFSLSET